MSNKTTVLRTRDHSEFLEARRQDPVTRKVFGVGDRVTLCATCLFPFLEESWIAIGGSHCKQFATVGVGTFDPPPQTHSETNGDNSDAVDTHGSDTASAAPSADVVPTLMPVPIKLKEVPIKLH